MSPTFSEGNIPVIFVTHITSLEAGGGGGLVVWGKHEIGWVSPWHNELRSREGGVPFLTTLPPSEKTFRVFVWRQC
jgi:hypothetical protein